MAKLVWGATGQRKFEVGVDRGVLYPNDGPGVPWNGLISVSEKIVGGGATPYYVNGYKYLNDTAPEDFEASIEAYTYPDEFAEIDGTAFDGNGLAFGLQPRQEFSLSYRTLLGDDVNGTSLGYRIHLVYNALASPTEKNHQTQDSNVDPLTFSWDLTTRPVSVSGRRASAHYYIDSTKTAPGLLSYVEGYLYGADGIEPRIPSMMQLASLFEFWKFTSALNFVGKISADRATLTNLATNPSFESLSGSVVTVQTNLATNPSFQNPGAAITVRSNLCTNPNPKTTARYSGVALSSVAAQWDATRFAVRSTADGSATPYVFSAPSDTSLVAGDKIAIRVKTRATRPYRIQAHTNNGNYYFPEGLITVDGTSPLTWRESVILLTLDRAVSTTDLFNVAMVSTAGAGTSGDIFEMGDVLIEKAPVALAYFDGDTTNAGDFIYIWNGTAPSSSQKQGTGITQYPTPASVAYAVQSSDWSAFGGKSLRLISTYSARGSAYTEIASVGNPRGLEAGKTYTLGVTHRRAEKYPTGGAAATVVLTGTTGGTNNVTYTFPNEVGEQRAKLVFTVPSSGNWYLRLYNNGMMGDPDVWFDALSIYEGNVSNAYYDGNTPNVGDFSTSWTGTPDDSTTIKTGLAIAGVLAYPTLAAVIQSTEWSASGPSSARIIPTSTSRDTFMPLPADALKAGGTYTMRIRGRLTAAQTSPGGTARRFYLNDGSAKYSPSAPNVAGDFEIVWTVTLDNDAAILRFYNGAAIGDSEMWVDALAIYEGTEAYPYFDGGLASYAYHDQILTPYWFDDPATSVSVVSYFKNLPSRSAIGDSVLIDDSLYIVDTSGIWQLAGPISSPL